MKKKLIEMPDELSEKLELHAKNQKRSGVKQIIHYIEQGIKKDEKEIQKGSN